MSWKMPTREEQEKHLNEIGAVLGGEVRFRTSNFSWYVVSWMELSDGGTLSVILRSPKSGRTRTAWPWELRAVG